MPIECKCEMYLNGELIAGFNAKVPITHEPSSQFFVDDSLGGTQEVTGIVDFMNMASSFTGTITTQWSGKDADNFFRALEGCLPPPEYRQRGLRIEVASCVEIAFSTPDGLQGSGKMWAQVAEARSQHTHVRLRRFVSKNGRAVEVRTRGRCGSRSMAEALEQANASMIGNSITLEGTIK